MDWKKIINFNQFKCYNNEPIEKYVLITHREINTRLEILSEINCLYTKDEKYLLSETIHKNFKSNIIYNYLYFDDKLYRICSQGDLSIYVDNQYITLNDIKYQQLYNICNYYIKDYEQLIKLIDTNNYNSHARYSVFLINPDFSIHKIYSYTRDTDFDISMQPLILGRLYQYCFYINTDYLIIERFYESFIISYLNQHFSSKNINELVNKIDSWIDIKINIDKESINNIFNAIKGNDLLNLI